VRITLFSRQENKFDCLTAHSAVGRSLKIASTCSYPTIIARRAETRTGSFAILAALLFAIATPAPAAVITNFLDDDINEEEWNGFLDIGIDFQEGGDKSREIFIEAEAERENEDSRWELEFEYLFSEEKRDDDADFIKFEDEYDISSQYDIFFLDRSYVWLSQALFADDVDDLEIGVELGLGLGHQIVTRGRLRKTQYEVEGGVIYIREDFATSDSEPDSDISLSGIVISHEFTYKIRRGVVFNHEFEILEILEPSSERNTLVEMENALAVSLGRDMFLKLLLETEWDEVASNTPGEESTEHQLLFKLGWRY